MLVYVQGGPKKITLFLFFLPFSHFLIFFNAVGCVGKLYPFYIFSPSFMKFEPVVFYYHGFVQNKPENRLEI